MKALITMDYVGEPREGFFPRPFIGSIALSVAISISLSLSLWNCASSSSIARPELTRQQRCVAVLTNKSEAAA